LTEAELAAYEAGKNQKNPRRRLGKEVPRMKASRVTKEQLEDRYEDFDGLCAYCRREMGINSEIDHIIPMAKGGLDIIENLVYACSSCNQSKNSHDLIPWLRSRPNYEEKLELKLLSVFPYLPLLFLDYYE
jgi:5-methylcytosine-specific restriction endonuclease McrA